MSVTLSLHRCIILFYAAMLATGFHVLFQLHPQCHASYMGDYLRWTFTELLSWAFKRDGRLFKGGV